MQVADVHPRLTRLVLIRHGETASNAERRLQGQLDVPLNALGRAQAARLGAALRDEGISVIVASDLGRAWQTAEALGAELGLAPQPEPALRERHYGFLQGQLYDEIDRRWPDESRAWRQREPAHRPQGGESLEDLAQRCLAAVDRWVARHPGETLALVSHGGVLDILHRTALRLPLQAPRTWDIANAAIQRLTHGPEGLALVGWNDQRHLEDLLATDDESA